MKLNLSVQKAATILRVAAGEPAGETASGLARKAGLPWATAVRFVRTLEAEGLLFRLPGSDRYVVGLELVQLARVADEGRLVTALARPALERLAAELEETVSLTMVRPDGRLEIVDQIDAPRLLRSAGRGEPYPLHATSMGKLLLASYDARRLDELLASPLERCTPATITDPAVLRKELGGVRESGWSEAVEELEDGLAGRSVRVLRPDGELLAMITISGPSFRLDESARRKALRPLRQAAETVERLLAGTRGRERERDPLPV